MDSERHHRTTTTSAASNNSNSSTSELFVCFTSRLSSSSMKLTSKSILSPSRGRDPPPQISLSASLSRRLKSNGSMKGGQASPMFPTNGKRRGCGFENPEPSSPKVTCIGQVRVKTKKQGKKMRARSKRRGEASFRKVAEMQGFQNNNNNNNNPDLTRQNSQSSFGFQNHSQSLQQECLKHRNQRWVHLPLTICEALREFSCFFPCRSSCSSGEREKEEKGVVVREGGGGSGGGDGREGSCGAALARWLVTLQEGDGKGRGIELVMEPEEDEEEDEEEDGREKSERSQNRSQRRHVFEDIDIDLVEDGKKKHEEFGGGEEEEKGRVSICIPPKNALLLMRCRSDPVKMAALANRFWESPLKKDQQEQEDSDGEEEQEEEEEEEEEGEQDQQIEMEEDEEQQEQKEVQLESKTEELEQNSISEEEEEEEEDDIVIPLQEQEEGEAKQDVIVSFNIETRLNPENNEVSEGKEEQDKSEDEDEDGEGEEGDANHHEACVSLPEADADLDKPETEDTHLRESEEEKENNESSVPAMLTSSEQENFEVKAAAEESPEEEETAAAEREEQAPTHEGSGPVNGPESKEPETGSKKETLPECLLLMMCEPKLSMEVSKETWVCSTDFIRRLPGKPAVKVDGGGGGKRVSLDSSTKVKAKLKPPQPQMQPPRSSCSFPAGGGGGMSMAMMIEQKLVGSHNGYEPFVLTRCKSEPMRSAAKLAPEACFWNNRKLEPTAPLGVGAQAGVGF
ncbi:uncharacterized protein LOC130747253 [Lotus japonicus]|uniref:uncharacterized protein LOC130747253 n=1 Tax=Lotus japonicus TaxID=34305 RepID=UPI00258B1C41|nr:uncharacterized protein LOC130747253 [Lotus japonicus]